MANNPQGTTTATSGTAQIFAPIKGAPEPSAPGSTGAFGNDRGDHIHAGNDIACSVGTPCIAPVNGRIVHFATDSNFAPGEGAQGGGGMVQFQFDEDLGAIKKGDIIGWGHVFKVFVHVGQAVNAGTLVATSGTAGSGPHVHFIYQSPGGTGEDGTDDPYGIYNYLRTNGKDSSGIQTGGGTGGGGSLDLQEAAKVAKAAAFATYLQFPDAVNAAESYALKGERSLMNDQPLFPFIEQLCKASQRRFQSMPTGEFFAFYADYFGGFNWRTPYWLIDDIEILDGRMNLSDDPLATHVYTVGDIVGHFDGVDTWDRRHTAGVVTIFNALVNDFISGPISNAKKDETKKAQAISFLKKYGARPFYEEMPMVRSPYYELFLAFQTYCLMWTKQFLSTFQLTFMPEVFPGGIVAFPAQGVQMFVEEVEHIFDYESGFQTNVNFVAPAAYGTGQRRANVHEGMIRNDVLVPQPQGNG